MSGGFLCDYEEYRINNVADAIERDISLENYSYEILEKFQEAAHTCYRAAEMAQCVDLLVSGEDIKGSFLERWEQEVRSPYDDVSAAMKFCCDFLKDLNEKNKKTDNIKEKKN